MFRLKRGLLSINPAESQDFVIMGIKLKKIMYFRIIIGSYRWNDQAIEQIDQVAAFNNESTLSYDALETNAIESVD